MKLIETTESKKTAETKRLITELSALPTYRGWRFTYEYPGFFCYCHPELPYSVFFTPDWDKAETLDIQVHIGDGRDCPDHGDLLPLPREGRTGQQIFTMVRPTLDKLFARTAIEVKADAGVEAVSC